MNVGIYDLYLKEDHLPYLAKISETNIDTSCVFSTTKRALSLLRDEFNANKLCEERMWMICLDCHLTPIGIFEICHGNGNSAVISDKAICQRALLCNASTAIIAHNHPSGVVMPSKADETSTKRIKRVLKLCEVTLLDHIIIGGSGNYEYFSFKEYGLLK